MPAPDDCPGLDGCEVAQPIRERMTALELAHRGTAAKVDVMGTQIAELAAVSVKRGEMIDAMRVSLDENSTLTRQTLDATNSIKDIVTTGRVMSRFARWLAPTLLATAAALAVVKGWAGDVAEVFRR